MMPRLDVLIARSSGLSRRQVTRLFRGKHIADEHGRVLDDPRQPLVADDLPRTVLVQGSAVVLRSRFELLLHKPVGVVTALRDDRHATAYALLEGAPLHDDLRAVGRLDKDTSGLLLWTTDGTLLHKLTHPRYALPRTYHAGLAGPFEPPRPELALDDGHRPEIVELAACDEATMHPGLLRSDDTRVFATITITTGRFHEVRRIFAALGTEVVSLCRVAFGGVELPRELEAGAWEEIDLKTRFRGLSPAS
jgi:16S rRNA pseudouridine516 synthase